MDERMLNISEITADPAVQPRDRMDMATVMEYAGEMQAGTQFPPVVVFYDGTSYWLADGFHRYEAARQSRYTVLAADVREGNRRDAVLYSVGANATHGLRRSNVDKRRAVETLLRDDEWRGWSDHEIARQCAVSAMFVGNLRREMSPEIGAPPDEVQAVRAGTVYTVQVDGRRASGLAETGNGEELRREVERELPEQMGLQPSAVSRQPDTRSAPVMTPVQTPKKLEMGAPTEERDVIASIRIKPGEPLAERPIQVTVSEEFGMVKWRSGEYGSLLVLLCGLLEEQFGVEDGGL